MAKRPIPCETARAASPASARGSAANRIDAALGQVLLLPAEVDRRGMAPVDVDLRVVRRVGETVLVAQPEPRDLEAAVGRALAGEVAADPLDLVASHDQTRQSIH